MPISAERAIKQRLHGGRINSGKRNEINQRAVLSGDPAWTPGALRITLEPA